MNQCQHSTNWKLPLKTENNVDHDHDKSKYHCKTALLSKLFSNLSTDVLRTFKRNGIPRCLKYANNILSHFFIIYSISLRDTHHKILGRTRILNNGIIVSSRGEIIPYVFNVWSRLKAHFNLDPACKVNS